MDKKSMPKKFNDKSIIMIFLFLLILIFQCPAKIAGSDLNGERGIQGEIVQGELGKKLDKYLMRITPFGFSGALLVAKEGKIILNKGYGLAIRSDKIPNTSETVFSTGSITKQFTAAGIMKLEMQGKLKTEDPISKYFKDVPGDKRGVTIHHLLTHTAGVIEYTGRDYEEVHRDETMRKILDAPLLFEPGQRFEYSNSGYNMLAAIIEKVSGKSYEEYLSEQLFKPAGMEFTGYRIPQWDEKVVAHWYVGEKDNGIPLEKPYPYWNLLGNGGILSTTGDMYRWHLALLGDEVLSAEARKKIFTPFLNDYGYGWDVLKTDRGTLIQHDGGSMLGNSAEIRRYIDANLVTILFCNQSFDMKPLMSIVRDKIETLVFGGDVAIPPPWKDLDPEKLRNFEGTYKFSSGSHLGVKTKGGKLIIKAKEQDAISTLYFPEDDNLYFFNDLNKSAVSVFEAALDGDFKPFEDVLHDKEERAGPVRRFIEMRINRYKERTGAIKKVVAIATVPSFLRGEKLALTYVQLKGEKGSIFFGLYWRGQKNIGVSPVMSVPDLSVPFMSISGNEFAGYHLDMAVNMRLSFNIDDKGFVTGLTVHGPRGDVSAFKIQDMKNL